MTFILGGLYADSPNTSRRLPSQLKSVARARGIRPPPGPRPHHRERPGRGQARTGGPVLIARARSTVTPVTLSTCCYPRRAGFFLRLELLFCVFFCVGIYFFVVKLRVRFVYIFVLFFVE